MGVSTFIEDAAFSKNIGSLQLPDRTALVGEWFFGVDEANTIDNKAGGAPLVVLGSPIYGSNYVEMTGGGYGDNRFNTPFNPPEFGDVTLIVVVFNEGAGRVSIPLNSEGFTALREVPNNAIGFFNGQSGTDVHVADVENINQSEWTMIAGAGAHSGLGEAHIWKNNSRSSAVAENAGGNRAQNPYEFNKGPTNTVRFAYAAIFERKLEPAELDIVYAGVKSLLATRGVNMT